MKSVFFLNSITEFNHVRLILEHCNNWVIATESQQLFQHLELNFPSIRILKIPRQNLI